MQLHYDANLKCKVFIKNHQINNPSTSTLCCKLFICTISSKHKLNKNLILFKLLNKTLLLANYQKQFNLHSSLTHSQLLERLKCEPQTENNRRVRSRSALPGSQHFGGVEGHVGALKWDQEELTSFIYSHKPAQNQRKVVSAQDKPQATRTHNTHHSSDLGEATTFPLIIYSAPLHGAHI